MHIEETTNTITKFRMIIEVDDPELADDRKEEILDWLCIVELLAVREGGELYQDAVDILFNSMLEYNHFYPDSKITLLVDEEKTNRLGNDYEIYKVVRPLGE